MPSDSQLLAQSARSSALVMCARSRAAHIGSSLSIIDILAVLYSGGARIAPDNLNDADRDVVVVAKGHAAAGVYAILAHAGFYPLNWLDSYCMDGGRLGGHVTSSDIPGVEFSTGSLGHGLPFGTGVALAKKNKGNKGQVFVIVSDGEMDEGTTWETALLASHNNLTNLTVIIDRNHLQSLGSTEETVRLEPLADKWDAFGWHVVRIDGHDHSVIKGTLDLSRRQHQPVVVIADTVKGKGVSFMENEVLWHYRSPGGEHLDRALEEVSRQRHA